MFYKISIVFLYHDCNFCITLNFFVTHRLGFLKNLYEDLYLRIRTHQDMKKNLPQQIPQC